jgi:hypothetical protein
MGSEPKSPALIMRILKYAFVASALLFVYLAFKLPVPAHVPVKLPVEIAIAFAGLASVYGGFMLPRVIYRAAERKPENNTPKAQLKRWKAKGILSLAYFESCVLFGLFLHFLEGHGWLVWLLFGVGIAAELFWSPGTPPAAGN